MSIAARTLACDLRSLALFRIALALVLLATFAAHAGASGSSSLVAWLGVFAAFALAAGYFTRAATLAAWTALAALSALAPAGHADGAQVLLALLVVAACLPLGARYAVDAALDPDAARDPRHTGLGAAALVVQLTWLLVSGALHRAPELSGVLAAAAPMLGVAAPVLALAPVWQTPARLVLVGAVLLTHVIAAMVSGTAIPALAVAAATLALVPGGAWEWLARRLHSPARHGLRIYYDRDCGFCRKTCYLLRTFLALGPVPVEPAQSDPAVHAIMTRHNTWVVYDHEGAAHIRWAAVLLLVRRSPLLAPLGRAALAAGMARWGDGLYEAVARGRGRLSRITAVLMPYRHVPVAPGPVLRGLCAVWLVLAGAAAVEAVAGRAPIGGAAVLQARRLVGLDQHWSAYGRPASRAAARHGGAAGPGSHRARAPAP